MRFVYGAVGMMLGDVFCKIFNAPQEYAVLIIAMFAAGAMAGGD